MANQIITEKGNPYPYGVTVLTEDSINVSIAMENDDCGIIILNGDKEHKLPFDASCKIGSLYSVRISKITNIENCRYRFYDGERVFVDSYAKVVYGNEKYGKLPEKIWAGLYKDDFDWEEDVPLLTPFGDSVFYQLHVRGFTKHTSSSVADKGTYEGLIEKIPYLNDLGITAVELMPAYEFLEMERKVMADDRIPMSFQETEPVLNYWGYKEGYYYAPKSSYAATDNPTNSFKRMVKELHKNGIEVIMQFYFPLEVQKSLMIDVLRYWVSEYHVDGFHLKGDRIPCDIIATDPMLKKTKLIYFGFPTGEIYGNRIPSYKNLAKCGDEYMYDMRKFLKSDERMVGSVLHHMKENPKDLAIVHYITESNGFTLNDLVSYDRKHNEDNGENNLDGNPYNASWNCGAEGKTKKKPVLELRLKQMKNAFLLNLFSQSTPMILSGDEFANSQKGNNNAYCQDNLISWLNWNDIFKNQEIYLFVKDIIAFRKENALLHKKKEYTLLDDMACGYPDLSYHSEEPWKCSYDDLTRHFAVMYCGNYSDNPSDKNTFIYMAVNMHWTLHEFALPKLPAGKKWHLMYDTESKHVRINKELEKQDRITVFERSIRVLVAY